MRHRSASEPVDGDDDADEIPTPSYDSGGNAVGDAGAAAGAAFRSTPGADAMLAAPTPGRETEGERTWVMARRVASNWEEEQTEEEKRRANGGAAGGAGAGGAGAGGSGKGMSPEGEKPSPEVPRT